MTEQRTADTTLSIRRTFRAPRVRVFEAFTDPAILRRWYAPVQGWEVTVSEVDLRVGGGYVLRFGPPGQPPIEEEGEYHEIVPGERLVYSVGLGRSDGSMDERTRVVVEFREVEGGCEVLVTEEGYSTPEIRDRHLGGWRTMLGRLEDALA